MRPILLLLWHQPTSITLCRGLPWRWSLRQLSESCDRDRETPMVGDKIIAFAQASMSIVLTVSSTYLIALSQVGVIRAHTLLLHRHDARR